MLYTIKNGELEVTVNSFGAEAVSVKYRGEERLWQNDNGTWSEHSPVLFPVCGHCGMIVGGVEYPIYFHGFAKRKEFKIDSIEKDVLAFSISEDEETLAVYPYGFTFRVLYRIEDNALEVKYEVKNDSSVDMYFACGGHDSFSLKTDVDGYVVEFDKTEKFDSLDCNSSGYLTGKKIPMGEGREFPLPKDFLTNNKTVIFGGVNSDKVTLKTVGGKKVAELTFTGFKNFLMWRPNGAKMICLEPWTNLPDLDGESLEISEKDGFIRLAPSASETIKRTIKYY